MSTPVIVGAARTAIGRSFKGTESAHGIIEPMPVSLAGDHFESHTGANTTENARSGSARARRATAAR